MKVNDEWFCDSCGEKLIETWLYERVFGQCICENCRSLNDIVEEQELQFDGMEMMIEEPIA